MTDPYLVLGVERTATDEQIKAAFRKLAMQWHPDRNPDNPDAENKFKELNAAYETLKDPQKRAAFDRPNDPFQNFRRNPNGFEFQGGFRMEDIINAFRQQSQQPRNRDYTVGCMIGLKDALKGCEVGLNVIIPETGQQKEIRVWIPAGIETGNRVRVTGAGENYHTDQQPGDLYVVVTVQNDPVFSRQGKMLGRDIKVDAIDAMLGNVMQVETLEGDIVDVPLPAGVYSGYKIRVSGRGMPIAGTQNRGDLIVNVVLTTSANLSEEQLNLLREIKRLSSEKSVLNS